MRARPRIVFSSCLLLTFITSNAQEVGPTPIRESRAIDGDPDARAIHREVPDDPWMPRPVTPPAGAIAHSASHTRGPYESIQINVDELGNNILGDAANDPSIAIDPTDPNRIVIGWRQFDSLTSYPPLAGWAYSHEGGKTWAFPGVVRDDLSCGYPVLDAGPDGSFYFYGTGVWECSCFLFRSLDGGVSWLDGADAYCDGSKSWMGVDQTDGAGRGNIYLTWSPRWNCTSGAFSRSTDGALTFDDPIRFPQEMGWGTIEVGPSGEVYVSGHNWEEFIVAWSTTLRDSSAPPAFDAAVVVDLGGPPSYYPHGPNPEGAFGQVWIATDCSPRSTRGNVYLLASVEPDDGKDPLDVMFSRSTDGGQTWSEPLRVNDDPPSNEAWQWFGTMSVAPHGRIDVVFNDTRNSGEVNLSELFYTCSHDAGRTWSANVPVSPMFDSYLGWPDVSSERKLGRYYDMISDDAGVNVAYAATFNGEQDVYFLRIKVDCNDNGITDAEEVIAGSSPDCDENYNPDECDRDLDGDGLIDGCDDDIDDDGVPNEADVCIYTPVDNPVHDNGRPLSDTDGDCLVGLIDYARLRRCLADSGPDLLSPPATCQTPFDYDGDEDVDLVDLAGFMAATSGSF